MGKSLRRVAAFVVVLLAFQSVALSAARTRVMMCAGCGTVIDVDQINYPRDKAPDGAVAGAIIGVKDDGSDFAARMSTKGLVGRDARKGDQGDDARGMRLEIRMDGGGERVIEITDGMRVYRRDRVKVHDDRIEVLD